MEEIRWGMIGCGDVAERKSGPAFGQIEHSSLVARITFSFFDSTPVCLETEQGCEDYTFPRRDPIHLPLIQLVMNELRGVGSCSSTGVSAARTNWAMEQIISRVRSFARGQKIDWIPWFPVYLFRNKRRKICA